MFNMNFLKNLFSLSSISSIFIFSTLLLINCSNSKKPHYSSFHETNSQIKQTPIPIFAEKDSITLLWLRPDINTDFIDHYKLYYRTDTSFDWKLIKDDIAASSMDTIKYRICKQQFNTDANTFYFAVCSGNRISDSRSAYLESDKIHASSIGGWFLIWNNNKTSP